ncbi:uncharacterized protein LOC135398266 [Ornithodoros turicata]|uniref:uncharacterized protein LOC135398266 n=1 Tax=Ornithodoros turicata TaxID=34597 RepID=UPI003138B616
MSKSSLVAITLLLATLSYSESYESSATRGPDYEDYSTSTAVPTQTTSLPPFHPRIEPAYACGADVTKMVEEVERALLRLPAEKDLSDDADREFLLRNGVLGISIHNVTIAGLDTFRPDRPVIDFCKDGEPVVKFSLASSWGDVVLRAHYGTYPDAYVALAARRFRVEVDFVAGSYWYGEKALRVDSINIVEAEGIEFWSNYRYIDWWVGQTVTVVLHDLIRTFYADMLRTQLDIELQEALR